MQRIFLGLASVNTAALLATFTIGLFCQGRANSSGLGELTPAQRMFTLHLFAGLLTTLLTLLLHSIVFTYFIGTGRWVREVVNAYRMAESVAEQSQRLKMATLPFVLANLTLVIVNAVLGAAADLGRVTPTVHLTLAVLTILLNFWGYLYEYRALRANGELIERIMADVTRMRRERGLE